MNKEWGAVRKPHRAPTGEGWDGLSEIATHGDWLYVVERDNHIGEAAVTKLHGKKLERLSIKRSGRSSQASSRRA